MSNKARLAQCYPFVKVRLCRADTCRKAKGQHTKCAEQEGGTSLYVHSVSFSALLRLCSDKLSVTTRGGRHTYAFISA